MEYRILTSDDSYNLAQKVETFLGDGWKLLGGASIALGSNYTPYYCQTMVKEKVND